MIDQIIFICITAFCAAFGIFLIKSPDRAFQIQQKFYRMINWHIEPISLDRERRNTRWMGIFLLVITVAAWSYRLLRP